MPKATRAELHEQFAAWLETRGAELVELDEIVGYHLEQAFRYRGELGPLTDSDRGASRHAAELLSRERAGERSNEATGGRPRTYLSERLSSSRRMPRSASERSSTRTGPH